MEIIYYWCRNCNGIVRFDGGNCENCGANIQNRESINETRVYQGLTAREKDSIKTFIVNSMSEFRIKNMALIQQNWQLQKPIVTEFWNNIAQSVLKD